MFFLFIFHRSLALLPFLITSLGKRRAYCFLVLLFQMVLSKTMGIARRSEQSRLDSNSNELPQDGVCAHTLLCQLRTLELFFSSFWRPHFFCLLFTYCVAEWKPRSYKKKTRTVWIGKGFSCSTLTLQKTHIKFDYSSGLPLNVRKGGMPRQKKNWRNVAIEFLRCCSRFSLRIVRDSCLDILNRPKREK